MKITECMPKMRDEDNRMYAQNEGWRVWNVCPKCGMRSMECMPKMRDEDNGMYAQNEG